MTWFTCYLNYFTIILHNSLEYFFIPTVIFPCYFTFLCKCDIIYRHYTAELKKGGQFMSNENKKLVGKIWFPDVTHLLYEGVGTLTQVQKLYIKEVRENAEKLRGTSFVPNYLDSYRNKLDAYLHLYNYDVLAELEEELIALKHFLAEAQIPCTITGRLKNYVSFLEKTRRLIYDGINPFVNNDELGFRIIVGTSRYDNENSIANLYEVINKVISFFVINKGYDFVKPSPAQGLGFKQEAYPKIFVPEKTLVYPEYAMYMKDYFIDPKESGYQAVHLVLLTKSGLKIEIQFRTFASHYHAEFYADHDQHKENSNGFKPKKDLSPEEIEAAKERKKAIQVVFDPNKVKLDSFHAEGGKIMDLAGLMKTITDPFNNFYVA